MRRDRKAAQKKKGRELARSKARNSASSGSRTAVLKVARESPFGPAYMSRSWREDTLPAQLVTVVLTRALPDGTFLPIVVLVDRTCLGVKNAFATDTVTQGELARLVDKVTLAHAEGVEQVEPALAQSVVFAAIDYAASLGFKPHRDFDATLTGPRPSVLEATPLARPARPSYLAGPDDDVERILACLRRAVGAEGFDLETPYGDEDDELTEDDEAYDESLPDEATLSEAIDVWRDTLRHDARLDLHGALEAYSRAIFVEAAAPGQKRELPPEFVTSLPLVWAAFFRPLPDGRTGLDLARESPAMAAYSAELAQLARTRAFVFDVLGIDPALRIVTCRDALDGGLLRVRVPSGLAKSVTRWTRFFGYLTPMADGTWYHPSALLGHPSLRDVEIATLITRLNDLLAVIGIAERVDPAAPARGLARFGALAHVVLQRLIEATESRPPMVKRAVYVVNSDGDRFEPHDAVLRPAPAHAEQLLAALSAADDFAKEDGFGWSGEPRGTRIIAHERIASVHPEQDGSIEIVANSGERFRRLLARLEALAGTTLEPLELEVTRPWEHNPHVVAEETPDTQRMVVGSAAVHGDPEHAIASAMLDNARRALDVDVPSLGGRPRDLVKTDEGRRRVELWIEEQEMLGIPSSGASSFVDLDGIRRELGLPPVLGA